MTTEQLDLELAADAAPIRATREERRVVWQPFDLSVSTLLGQLDSGSLVLESDIQRPYMWPRAKASRLIESLLLNVPIPVCYFAEDPDDNHYEVIDGHQRLSSIEQFVLNGWHLTGLKTLTEFNNKKFDKLPARDQRALLQRTIRCIVLTAESHPEVKFDVFERLNTGAVSLSAQELRNCVYRGRFNDLVKTLAGDSATLRAFGRVKKAPRLRNEELILRFFALREDIANYKPPLRQWLNEYAQHNREPSPEAVLEFRQTFNDARDAVSETLGEWAFRGQQRSQSEQHEPEVSINAAVFDAEMLNFSLLSKKELAARRGGARAAVLGLLSDAAFIDATSGATADRVRVRVRMRMLSTALADVGLDNGLAELLPADQDRLPLSDKDDLL